jgi:hypothetical protein
LAVDERRLYVLGQNWTVPDSMLLPPNPLVALGPSGNIGHPRGRFSYHAPKAILDPAGTLHLLWADPQRPDSVRRTRFMPQLTSIWYASFAGGKWSAPERVYTSTGVMIFSADEGSLLLDSTGRLHFTFLEWRHPRGLVHVTRSAGHWVSATIPFTSHALYGSLTPGRGGALYLAYVAPDTTLTRDAGSVFLTHSPDAGKTWERPVLVSRSGRMQATSVRALMSREGVLHLVWGQNLTGGLVAQVIRHVESRDGGRAWTTPSDLPTDPSFRSDLRAAIDDCGVIHVIYHDSRPHVSLDARVPSGSELRYARWDGQWRGPDSPFPTLNPIGSDLARDRDGRIHLFLMARPEVDHTLKINFLPMVAVTRTGAR